MGIERALTTYVCDLSGLADEAIEETDSIEEDDPLQDAPNGWTQIVVRTRMVNPNHIQANQVYAQAVAEVRAGMKDEKDPARVNAALFALEQQFAPILDTPMFLTNESEMWVHPTCINELMKRLDPETAEIHSMMADEIKAESEAAMNVNTSTAEPEAQEVEAKPKPKRTRKKAPAKAAAEAK